MTTIYLARHGQTEENLMRIFQGHLPGTLTADGIEQAINLGKELKDTHIDCILSSDLKRVTDTVSYAMKDRNLPWEMTKLLREIDWGKWTGLKLIPSINRIHRKTQKQKKCYTNVGSA